MTSVFQISRRGFLVSGAAATGTFAIPRAFAADDFDMPEFVKGLRELVSIDSKSGHEEGTSKVVDIMARRFESIGWTVTKHYCAGRGDALVATSLPDQSKFDVALCAHADTVQPVGNAAKYPLRIEGALAYGAGVADDKSSLNAVWWICKGLPKRITQKINIAVIVNPGEESGSDASRAFMTAQAKKTPVALIYEPGRGEVKGGAFVKARKGCMFLTVKFHGVPAHAGNNPDAGRNAIHAMALAIPQIEAIAKRHPDTTLNGDVAKGGTVPNTIAAEAEVVFDFRFFDDKTRDTVLSEIRDLCRNGFMEGVTSELIEPRMASAMAQTEQSKQLAALVDKAASELGQPRPQWLSVGGASDGNRFFGAGAAVVCAMGVVGGNLHNAEKEWSDLSTAHSRIRLGQKVIELLAAQR